MRLIILFAFLTVLVYARDLSTCYSVQLLSFGKNQTLKNISIPQQDCQVITINGKNTLRCGCKDNYKEIKKDLKKIKRKYPKAFITATYRYRFAKHKNIHKKQNPTCYSVELKSSKHINKTSSILDVLTDNECKILKISKYETLRCGCYDSYEDSKQKKKEYLKKFPNAIITKTYRYRFGKVLDAHDLKKFYDSINWNEYYVENLKHNISKKTYGNGVHLVSIKRISFLIKSNVFEQKKRWEKMGILWPKVIILSNGRYDLESIYKKIDDKNIIEKTAKNTYLIKRPLYISPTASLLLYGVTMKLSIEHGTFVVYNGKLDVVDSKITSWSIKKNNYGKRKKLDENKLLFYLRQETRPYLVGRGNSFTRMINSTVIGLGYKGLSSTFGGLTLSSPHHEVELNSIKNMFKMYKKPGGIYIGNDISECFFGLFTNNASDVFVSGNILHDNVVYNFDPHDFSTNLLIARNISYNARHAHGIIFSREVNNSVIAQNLVFSNVGSGIMLDRNSQNNLIYDNITFQNKGDGISIFESDYNTILKNTVVRNFNNGIFVRNSKDIFVKSNYVFKNGNNGAEVSTLNIDFLETRNFKLDPYHQFSKVSFVDNYFSSNLNSLLSVKRNSFFFFKHNKIENSGPLYFSGKVADKSLEIFEANKKDGFLYTEVKK